MSDSENQVFESLALQNMGYLYSKAIGLAGNASQAEALVQHTFASAYCVFEQYDQSSDFRKWLDEIFMFAYNRLSKE